MKMKLKMSLIVVTVMAATCLFAGERGSNPKELEQRLAALEQVVVAQQAQIESLQQQVAAQSQQVATHQQEIAKLAPFADLLEIYTFPSGNTAVALNANLTVNGSIGVANYLSVVGDFFLTGGFYNYGSQ